jgi:hypothetical protein
MHRPINVKSPNNISKRQTGFNSAFEGLEYLALYNLLLYDADGGGVGGDKSH